MKIPGLENEQPSTETEKLVVDLFHAIANLLLMMLPDIPRDPAVFQHCLSLKTRVRSLLMEDAKKAQSVQARLLALGGGKAGISATDSFRLRSYFTVMNQAYTLYYRANPAAETDQRTLLEAGEKEAEIAEGLDGLPRRSKGCDWIFDSTERYTFMRSILHHAIVYNQTRLARPVPDSRIPCALLLVGGFPAEAQEIREALQEKQGDLAQLTPWQILLQLPEYYEILDMAATQEERDSAPTFSEEEVADITTLLLQTALEERYNIFIDGLGADPSSFIRIARYLSQSGYRLIMLGVTESLATAMRRAEKFSHQTHMTVDKDMASRHILQLQEILPTLLRKTKTALLYDFDGQKPHILWAKQGEASKVYDQQNAQIKTWSLG